MDSRTGPPVHPISPIGNTSRRAAPLLVGRTLEQKFLREELASALSGRGRVVLLGGEAGMGKTALARDLSWDAEHAGVRVIAGHCYDLTNTAPYGPWLELFSADRNDPRWPALPAAFTEGRLGHVTDQSALFADVQRFIAELGAIRPVYILLEDLHWADPASVELLRHVAPTIHRLPILLVVTYRLEELSNDDELVQHLPALVREAGAARLEPRRLEADSYRALVAARYRLGSSDTERLVSYLERHAEGNPFFAVELLRTLEVDGLLRAGNDRSALGELARVVVPALLRQVIDGRVARLGDEIRHPLMIAAVIGQEIPLALWSDLAVLDEEAMFTVIERLVEAHLLDAEQSGTHVRFVHALTREAIYEGIIPPRRRAWHRRIAEALAVDPDSDPDTVAAHFQQAGDPRACEWLERAGHRAQRAYAWRTASDRFRAAAALLEGIAGQEAAYCQLVLRVAYLLRFSDTTASIAALDVVERLADQVGDSILAAEVQHVRGIHLCYAGTFRSGVQEMLKGVEALEQSPLDAARASAAIRMWFANGMLASGDTDLSEDEFLVERLRAAGFDFRRCTHLWHSTAAGHVGAAVAFGEHFVTLLAGVPGAKGGVRIASAFAYHALGIAYAALGRPDDARRACAFSRELFAEVIHFAVIAFSFLGELRDVAMTYGAADPGYRRRLAADAEAALSKAGGALRPGVSPRLAWLGCLVLDGQWEEADRILCDLPATGNAYLQCDVTVAVATLARHRGDPDTSWAAIVALLPHGPATEPGDIIHQEGLFLQRLAAELCLDGGDLDQARTWLEANDRWLAWSGSVLGRAEGRLAWARLCHAAGDGARAAALASEALDLAARPEQPLVRLAAHRLLGEIGNAGEDFEVAREHLDDSLDLARRCDSPFEQALTSLALAELHCSIGARETAASILEEVRDVCIRLNAGPTLARVEMLLARLLDMTPGETYPAGLTKREAEVLGLLAQHRTDKEIAAALFISPHTASTHVKHILTKLGVANRREAASYADRLGLA